jgi:hypothetical protein
LRLSPELLETFLVTKTGQELALGF